MPSEAEVKLSTESSSSSRPSAEDVRPDVAGLLREMDEHMLSLGVCPECRSLIERGRSLIDTLAGERDEWLGMSERLNAENNVLSRKLAEAERQLAEYRADAERLCAALQKYGCHIFGCAVGSPFDDMDNVLPKLPCDCGFDAARGASTKEVDRG